MHLAFFKFVKSYANAGLTKDTPCMLSRYKCKNPQQWWHEISKLGPWKVIRIPNAAKLENMDAALMAV